MNGSFTNGQIGGAGRVVCVAGAALIVLLIGSCGPKRVPDPIATMADPTQSLSMRMRAARQAAEDGPDDPRRIATLRELVWKWGQPAEMRILAIEQLIAHDPGEARAFLNRRLPIIDDWQTFDHIGQLILENHWTDLTSGLVWRYAMPTSQFTDADRPERRVIAQLHPDKTVEQVVVEVLADPASGDRARARAAAWQLLCRLADRPQRLAWLAELPADNPLVADLKAAGDQLKVMPGNVQTITWLTMLRTQPYQPFWTAARDAVAQLSPDQQAGLQLRHLPALVWLAQRNDRRLDASREQLLARVEQRVKAQRHYLKGPTYDGPMDLHPQQLRNWSDQLSFGDLLVISFIQEALADRELVESWFEQAEADRVDKMTEHGGLLGWAADGSMTARASAPAFRRHDRVFYPPQQMIIDAYTALCHYHFHAQRYNNRDYAGPGLGDLQRIAQTQQFNGLVFTFIDRDTLNVDYYQPHDVVIDLGVIER